LGASGLAFDRPVGHRRWRFGLAGPLGEEPAGRGVQRGGVDIGEHPTDGGLARRLTSASQRLNPRLQPGQDRLRGLDDPLAERGEAVVADRRARDHDQGEHRDQAMATPARRTWVGHFGQVVQQPGRALRSRGQNLVMGQG
jgi:hypothetical protein